MELSREERAYRRGALQALQFVISDYPVGATRANLLDYLARCEQALVKASQSDEARYLGIYMDEVMKDVKEGS